MAKSKKILNGEGWSFEPAGGAGVKPDVISLPPEKNKAKITLEKRPKGKMATVLSGFTLSGNDRKKLAASLRKRCGSGGSDTPDRIEVQGDHCAVVRELLSGEGWKIR